MTQDSLQAEKDKLRKRMRQRCAALDGRVLVAQSAAACGWLCSLPQFQQAEMILAYKPMDHEGDPGRAVMQAMEAGKRVAYPLCGPAYSLRLLLPLEPEAFIRGRYGLWEPIPARCREVQPDEIQLIIVPGMAFDRQCRRLGKGGGYYDRLLAASGAFCAGFALDTQLVAHVPTGEQDIPMDAVVFSGGIWIR